MDYKKIIEDVRKTIQSGYYQRFAPIKKEKKSLVEEIEKTIREGKIFLIAEVMACDEKKLWFSTKAKLLEYLHNIDLDKKIKAIDIWIEPKTHSGDLRWLEKNFKKIIIANDHIIDPTQMVGGDVIVLDFELIKTAEVNLQALIDFAHEEEFETILKVKNESEFEEAKKTETDVIMIENKNKLNSQDALTILNKNKTNRPIIAKNGIYNENDVRKMIIAGVNGFEIGYEFSNCPIKLKQRISKIERSIKGTENDRYENIVVVK